MLYVIDAGEIRHVIIDIKNVKGNKFAVTAATYEFTDSLGVVIDSGAANIIDNVTLDVVIEPPRSGDYNLKYTYYIADETLVDDVKVVVV